MIPISRAVHSPASLCSAHKYIQSTPSYVEDGTEGGNLDSVMAHTHHDKEREETEMHLTVKLDLQGPIPGCIPRQPGIKDPSTTVQYSR